MKQLTKRVWERLQEVRSLSFVATSIAAEKTGWTGAAKGVVEVQRHASACIHFVESGSWSVPPGKETKFSNTYRWTLLGTRIRLEHLRFGAERPVHLVDFVPEARGRMSSESPHACAADLYGASLELGDDLKLSWAVTGPRKRETIDCRYSTKEPARTDVPADAAWLKRLAPSVIFNQR